MIDNFFDSTSQLTYADIVKKTLPAHSERGPSSAKRWFNCPGSVRATRGVKEERSEYAAEGTFFHTIADRCALAGCRAEKFRGEKLTIEGFTFEMNEEAIECVNDYLDYVFDIKGVWFSENRIHYTKWVEDGFGTSDRQVVNGEWLEIADLKGGKGVLVTLKDDPQLRLYALGFLHDYGWLFPELKYIRLHIVQPRLRHIDVAEMTVAELLKWADTELVAAAKRTEDPDAPFAAGDWCQFCKIKKTCATRARKHIEDMTGELDKEVSLDDQINLIPRTPMPSQQMHLTNEQFAKLWRLKALAVKWWGDLDSVINMKLRAGEKVGDMKLVHGKSARVFTVSEQEVIESLAFEGFEKEQLMTKPELLSVAQMESVVGKKNEVLQTLYKKIEGAPTLALGSDKRKAIEKIVAADEFEIVASDDLE